MNRRAADFSNSLSIVFQGSSVSFSSNQMTRKRGPRRRDHRFQTRAEDGFRNNNNRVHMDSEISGLGHDVSIGVAALTSRLRIPSPLQPNQTSQVAADVASITLGCSSPGSSLLAGAPLLRPTCAFFPPLCNVAVSERGDSILSSSGFTSMLRLSAVCHISPSPVPLPESSGGRKPWLPAIHSGRLLRSLGANYGAGRPCDSGGKRWRRHTRYVAPSPAPLDFSMNFCLLFFGNSC